MLKGMTLYSYELSTVSMGDGKPGKESTISPYKDAEMVLKSVQPDMMKARKVAISATLKEARKAKIDLDAAWEAAAPGGRSTATNVDKPSEAPKAVDGKGNQLLLTAPADKK
jgi:hypothetical protein